MAENPDNYEQVPGQDVNMQEQSRSAPRRELDEKELERIANQNKKLNQSKFIDIRKTSEPIFTKTKAGQQFQGYTKGNEASRLEAAHRAKQQQEYLDKMHAAQLNMGVEDYYNSLKKGKNLTFAEEARINAIPKNPSSTDSYMGTATVPKPQAQPAKPAIKKPETKSYQNVVVEDPKEEVKYVPPFEFIPEFKQPFQDNYKPFIPRMKSEQRETLQEVAADQLRKAANGKGQIEEALIEQRMNEMLNEAKIKKEKEFQDMLNRQMGKSVKFAEPPPEPVIGQKRTYRQAEEIPKPAPEPKQEPAPEPKQEPAPEPVNIQPPPVQPKVVPAEHVEKEKQFREKLEKLDEIKKKAENLINESASKEEAAASSKKQAQEQEKDKVADEQVRRQAEEVLEREKKEREELVKQNAEAEAKRVAEEKAAKAKAEFVQEIQKEEQDDQFQSFEQSVNQEPAQAEHAGAPAAQVNQTFATADDQMGESFKSVAASEIPAAAPPPQINETFVTADHQMNESFKSVAVSEIPIAEQVNKPEPVKTMPKMTAASKRKKKVEEAKSLQQEISQFVKEAQPAAVDDTAMKSISASSITFQSHLARTDAKAKQKLQENLTILKSEKKEVQPGAQLVQVVAADPSEAGRIEVLAGITSLLNQGKDVELVNPQGTVIPLHLKHYKHLWNAKGVIPEDYAPTTKALQYLESFAFTDLNFDQYLKRKIAPAGLSLDQVLQLKAYYDKFEQYHRDDSINRADALQAERDFMREIQSMRQQVSTLKGRKNPFPISLSAVELKVKKASLENLPEELEDARRMMLIASGKMTLENINNSADISGLSMILEQEENVNQEQYAFVQAIQDIIVQRLNQSEDNQAYRRVTIDELDAHVAQVMQNRQDMIKDWGLSQQDAFGFENYTYQSYMALRSPALAVNSEYGQVNQSGPLLKQMMNQLLKQKIDLRGVGLDEELIGLSFDREIAAEMPQLDANGVVQVLLQASSVEQVEIIEENLKVIENIIPNIMTKPRVVKYMGKPQELQLEAPQQDQPVSKPNTDQIMEMIAPEPVVQQPAPEPVVQQPAAEPVVQQPAPEPVVQQPAPEPVVQQPAAEPVVQQPAPEPVVQQPAPQQSANDSIETISNDSKGAINAAPVIQQSGILIQKYKEKVASANKIKQNIEVARNKLKLTPEQVQEIIDGQEIAAEIAKILHFPEEWQGLADIEAEFCANFIAEELGDWSYQKEKRIRDYLLYREQGSTREIMEMIVFADRPWILKEKGYELGNSTKAMQMFMFPRLLEYQKNGWPQPKPSKADKVLKMNVADHFQGVKEKLADVQVSPAVTKQMVMECNQEFKNAEQQLKQTIAEVLVQEDPFTPELSADMTVLKLVPHEYWAKHQDNQLLQPLQEQAMAKEDVQMKEVSSPLAKPAEGRQRIVDESSLSNISVKSAYQQNVENNQEEQLIEEEILEPSDQQNQSLYSQGVPSIISSIASDQLDQPMAEQEDPREEEKEEVKKETKKPAPKLKPKKQRKKKDQGLGTTLMNEIEQLFYISSDAEPNPEEGLHMNDLIRTDQMKAQLLKEVVNELPQIFQKELNRILNLTLHQEKKGLPMTAVKKAMNVVLMQTLIKDIKAQMPQKFKYDNDYRVDNKRPLVRHLLKQILHQKNIEQVKNAGENKLVFTNQGKLVSEMTPDEVKEMCVYINSKYSKSIHPEKLEKIRAYLNFKQDDLVNTILNPKSDLTNKQKEFFEKTTLAQIAQSAPLQKDYKKLIKKTNIPVLTVKEINELPAELRDMPLLNLFSQIYKKREKVGQAIAGMINGQSWKYDDGGSRYTGKEKVFEYPAFNFQQQVQIASLKRDIDILNVQVLSYKHLKQIDSRPLQSTLFLPEFLYEKISDMNEQQKNLLAHMFKTFGDQRYDEVSKLNVVGAVQGSNLAALGIQNLFQNRPISIKFERNSENITLKVQPSKKDQPAEPQIPPDPTIIGDWGFEPVHYMKKLGKAAETAADVEKQYYDQFRLKAQKLYNIKRARDYMRWMQARARYIPEANQEEFIDQCAAQYQDYIFKAGLNSDGRPVGKVELEQAPLPQPILQKPDLDYQKAAPHQSAIINAEGEAQQKAKAIRMNEYRLAKDLEGMEEELIQEVKKDLNFEFVVASEMRSNERVRRAKRVSNILKRRKQQVKIIQKSLVPNQVKQMLDAPK